MDKRATDIKEGDLVDVGHHKGVRVIRIQYGQAIVDIGGRLMQFYLENLRSGVREVTKCDVDHRSESEDDIT